jgi:hypothetical protein
MSLDQIRSKLRSSVWEGMVASGIDLSSLRTDQRNKLTDTITDQVALAVNEILDDIAGPPPSATNTEGTEQIIWQGRPFLSLVESYVITTERVRVMRGLVGRDMENFELIRVQDIDVSQSVGERMFGLGDINIIGADRSTPTLVLRNIKDPQEVYEKLRKAWLAARKNYGIMFREEM